MFLGSFAFLNLSDVLFQSICPNERLNEQLAFALIATGISSFIIIQIQLLTARHENRHGNEALIVRFLRKIAATTTMGCGLAVAYAWCVLVIFIGGWFYEI